MFRCLAIAIVAQLLLAGVVLAAYTPQGNLISTANSTTALLAGDATYQGTGEDVTGFTTVSVSILGSLSTATGTLYFQASSDNSIWSSVPRGVTDITADVPHMWVIAERYFRVKYVNDSVAQTGTFRIQTMYANGRSMTLSTTLDSPVSINQDVTLARTTSPIDLDMARELITGKRAFFFFGFNDDVDAAWEDVHAAGGDINWLTAATKVEVISSDDEDDDVDPRRRR